MRMPELSNRLRAEGMPGGFYSFNREEPPIEGYILEKSNDVAARGLDWAVLYTDRGYIREIARFYDEGLACDYFYRRLFEVYGPAVRGNKN